MDEARYPYVAVDVAEHESDEAGALLFQLGAQGIEQRDQTTMVRGAGGKVTLVASFEQHDAARAALDELPPAWSARVEHVVGDAWRDEWKKYFEPFRICDAVVVRPPWTTYEPAAGERVIVLEPGRAFGTGLHETTNLVAGALADPAAVLKGSYVLDVGCGSGILALVAVALGARGARAIDVDPDAVAVTRENADRNGWRDRVHADDTDLRSIAERYPIVLANIEAKTLVEIAPVLSPRLAPGGRLVLGGILAPDVAPRQLDEVRRAYARLREQEVRRKGEWVALVMTA